MHLLLLGALAAPVVLAASTPPIAVASTADGSLKLSLVTSPVKGAGTPGSNKTVKVSIDDTASGHKQTVRGFGAAVTDSTVEVFNKLPSDQLSKLLSQLLSSGGANFALMRHTIGSSDLSADPVYTYDDSNGPDTSLSQFSLGSRGTAMADLLAKMKQVQPQLTLLGTPWSPPGWMKLNGKVIGSTVNNNLNPQYQAEFGAYFAKYLQAFQARGITVDAITIQNEPLNSQSGMPTLYVAANQSGTLIQDAVGPAIRNAGLHTSVWAYDHNTDVPSYPQTVLDIASEYVNTVAWHCYAPNNNWGALTTFHNKNPHVDQVMTECWTSSTSTPWNQAAGFTMGPLQNWASGAISWVLGTDISDGPHLSTGGCDTCRGLVTVDVNAGTYQFQVDYYMLAQFSKYIPKGAIILSGSGNDDVQSVASLNPDGSRTLVVENTDGNPVYVILSTKSGETWSGLVPAKSVTTWVLPQAVH